MLLGFVTNVGHGHAMCDGVHMVVCRSGYIFLSARLIPFIVEVA